MGTTSMEKKPGMMGKDLSPLCFAATASEVGEGPFWWKNALWWVDINPGFLHRCKGVGQPVKTWKLGDRTGAIVPVAGYTSVFIAAQQSGFHRISLKNAKVVERAYISHPESHLPNNRFNDGKCDAKGRFWAGTMSRKQEREVGGLYCLGEHKRIDKKIGEVSLSNGLGWSPDDKTFYFIDTPTRKIDTFRYDLAKAEISNRTTILECPTSWGFPDGMTVDAEGMLWVAFWDGGCVRRIDPKNGREISSIQLPCSRVTSCCFGGKDYDELYITTARGIDNKCDNEPQAGHVFVCKPGVRGLPCHPFPGK